MTVQDVHAEVQVDQDMATAFRTFVHGIDRWWPKANTFGRKDAAVAIEPWAGGQWYEQAHDGTRTPWGDVLEVEADRRLVLTWGISPDQVPWKPEPDPQRRSVLQIAFEPDAARGTRVRLAHQEIARHGEKAQDMADAMASEYGWSNLLDRYKQACDGAPG
jgi:uncharacterized protein YndB with AHSA1/START domain